MKKEKKKSFIKKIPGFRSGKWWKMSLASVFYLIIGASVLGILMSGSSTQATSSSKSEPICPDLSVTSERISCYGEENRCYFPAYDEREWGYPVVNNLTIYAPNSGTFNMHSGVNCYRGNKVGENNNYFYCRNLWTKQLITKEDGTVLRRYKTTMTVVVGFDGESITVIDTLCKHKII